MSHVTRRSTEAFLQAAYPSSPARHGYTATHHQPVVVVANDNHHYHRYDPTQQHSLPRPIRSKLFAGPTGNLVSGNLISDLAVIAIQLCLKDYVDVACDLTANPQDIFQGRIGPVTVKGKEWKSSRGLTCKAIEASVDSCQLDMGRILSEQTLVLTRPTEGKCMIALTAKDFGNFVVHPRLEKAKLQASQSAGLLINAEEQKQTASSGTKTSTTTTSSSSPSLIDFQQENVVIDPASGSVTFFASCAGIECKCVLERSKNATGPKAQVRVTTLDQSKQEQAVELSKVFTDFFNNITFELYDGLLLSFRDMMVTGKGASPSVLLSLNIRVEKFPTPGNVRPSEI